MGIVPTHPLKVIFFDARRLAEVVMTITESRLHKKQTHLQTTPQPQEHRTLKITAQQNRKQQCAPTY
jgi:hypothetical protein